MLTQNSLDQGVEMSVGQKSVISNNQEKIILKTWTEDKEEFIMQCDSGTGEWYITNDDRLIDSIEYDLESYEYYNQHSIDDYDFGQDMIKYNLFITGCDSSICSTYWLRSYCEEYHPDIDFDKEFLTDRPGVFGRYQDKFGHDYEEWISKSVYTQIKDEIDARGYKFIWD